ncbi:MAG: GEVED domain-containing protein [Flavobacteriales bacterium]|jgi:hypothetical protein
MLRKLLLFAVAVVLSHVATAQRICGTTEAEQYVRSNDDKYDQRRQNIENFTNEFISHGGGLDRALVTIPVVVHVVWNTATENISEAQILSQIAVLNADFRKLNSDAASVPAAFAGLAADANIEFCLATIDPSGNPTTGITRTQTATTAFGTNDQVKSSATGGVNAWPRDQYLNMWVCDISGGILGYAQFPGGGASTDGVVVDYQYFGTTGTATAPFNKGRTATHEVGHWLNLFHIWGDDGTGCTGSDQVADTPNAGGPNYGCPSFPRVTCSNGPNGDMFMNYMDYTDDACMYMFSTGQAARMQALFAPGGFRAALLNSNGCGSTANLCATPSGLSTTGVTGTSANFAWSASASATSYNLRYKLTSSTTWTTVNGLTTTSFAASALAACSAYEWQVQSVCSATSSSNFSASATFSTTGCVPSYCASNGGTADEFINTVVLNTINNTSGNNGGYANFTSISTTLNTGTAYTFQGTPGFTSTAYNETWRVWIDYNQDLDFDDAGELVYTSANTSAAVNGTFTVPSTATLGNTRMRVSMKYNAAATPCEVFQYGEVEDYTVSIAQGASCGTPTGLAVSNVAQTTATASWAALSGATSYSFQYKTSAATTWITVTTASTSVSLTGLVASTVYNTRVAAICSGVTGAVSAQVNFTTLAPVATCTDNFETNNTSAQAKAIAVNTNITARIGTATDVDWFRFSNTTTNRNIRIDLTNLPADYDVRLLNPSGVQVGISQNSGTAAEAIVFNNGPVGTYRVHVYGYNGAFNSTLCYTLRASRSGTAFRDGGEAVEEEVMELVASEPMTELNVFPNPTNDNVDITFMSDEDRVVNVMVYDMTGRMVYNTAVAVISGYNKMNVEMAAYAPGFYTIVLNDGENAVSTKVMKQ